MTEGINARLQRLNEQLTDDLQKGENWTDFFELITKDPSYLGAIDALDQYGVKGLEPYIAKHRRTALASAKQGDMSELSKLVLEGKVLNPEERKFVADWLNGERPKPEGRPPKHDLKRRINFAYFWLTEIDGHKAKAAVSILAERFGLAQSTVNEHRKSGKNCVVTQERIAGYRTLVRFGPQNVVNYFRNIDEKSG